MVRSVPRTVTLVILLLAAAVLPVVGVAAGGHAEPTAACHPDPTTPGHNSTIRLHRVPNDTEPSNLPDHVGIDEPSDPMFFTGDRLVVTVQSRALAADISNASGANLTERFAATQRDGSRLRFEQTNPRSHYAPLNFDFTDVANVTVVAGDRPATYHVVVDTWAVRKVRGTPGGEHPSDWHHGLHEMYEFYADLSEPGFARDFDTNRTITVEEHDVHLPNSDDRGLGQELWLDPTADASVDGLTTLPASAPVTVEVRERGTEVVVATDRTTVERLASEDGTTGRFAVTLNLSGERGGGYELHITSNGSELTDPVSVAVVPREASLSLTDERARWNTTVEDARLTYGGFVVLHRGSADGPVLGVSEYVSPGRTWDVAVEFDEPIRNRTPVVAVAHRDVDRNGEFGVDDEPYRGNGSVVADTAVLLPRGEGTADGRTNASMTDTTASTTATVGPVDRSETPGDGSTPGFGVIAAVAALSAAGVLRRVRGC